MSINDVTFSCSDDCIEAACGHANKTKEQCEVIFAKTVKDFFWFKIIFKPSFNSFSVRRYYHNPRNKVPNGVLGPLYYRIIESYSSLDDFINNHSGLIIFF
jgi:hypothetical protein